MKRLPLILSLLFSITSLFAQNGWRDGEMEVKVYLTQAGDLSLFRSLGLNAESAAPDGSIIRAYVIPSELTSLIRTGLKYEVAVPDLSLHSSQVLQDGSVLGYYNFTTITALADSLVTAFPSICKKILIGTSAGGRQLAVLKISDNVNTNENEAEILFESGIHGDEIMGPEVVIRYARDLCTGYGSNVNYTELINSREIWLYYLVNPDGYVTVSRYNANGVDLNRDCGYMWGAEGFSSGAFSQPESKAVRGLQIDHNPTVFTCYHGGTEVISYPWSYKTESPVDINHINLLASVYSNTSGYPNLGYGQGYNIMYQIFGSTKDYVYGTIGQVGWSIEITNLKQPPPSQIGLYYGYNVPAITEMVRRSGYGVEGIVTDSLTGSPVKATVWVDNFFPVYTDPQVGDYHKFVLPGSRTVKVMASGYKTKTVTGVQVPVTGSVVTNFQLAPDPGRYAYRVVSNQIPSYPSIGSYPDETYTPGAIGPPDSICYSLGRGGWIILDMGDTIFNGSGPDFKIWESGGTPEGYSASVGLSMDGPWTGLGMATGTHAFDLGTASVPKARYVRILDDGDGSISMPDAGFDLDAVELLTPPLIVDFTANTNTPCYGTSVNFYDNSTGSPTTWNWSFPGGTPSSSTLPDPTGIQYNTPGIYDVTLTAGNGFSTVTYTKAAFINVQGPPPVPTVPSGPQNTCANDTTSYTTTGTLSATEFVWSLWPPDAGTTSGVWMTCDVDWNDSFSGDAWLKVKEVSACGESDFTDSLQVAVMTVPVVDLGEDTLVCLGDSTLLDAGNPGCAFLWSSGDTTQTIWVAPGITGNYPYWVQVTNSDNCSGYDEIMLWVEVCDGLPETGSGIVRVYPNPSDGKFSLVTTAGEPLFRIYNSVGSLVLEGRTRNYGIIDVTNQPDGIYLLWIEIPGARPVTTRLILQK